MLARMREIRWMNTSASSVSECTHASLIRKVLECSGIDLEVSILEYPAFRSLVQGYIRLNFLCILTLQQTIWKQPFQTLKFRACLLLKKHPL